jgi:hypothetical protein
MKIKFILTSIACVAGLVLATGCSSITRGTPNSGTHINANMDKNDYEVGATTSGTSTKESYLCGLFQVIDGDKFQVLWFIKFFEDQYAFQEKDSIFVSIEDRAYYKALAATPDADSVAVKSWTKTTSGFPLFYSKEEVTFQGKALKFKVHN